MTGKSPQRDENTQHREIPRLSAAEFEAHVSPFLEDAPGIAENLLSKLGESKLKPAKKAGELVKTMRLAAGLSQDAVGKKAMVKQSDISAIENGSGEKGPTFDVLSRIADACGYAISFVRKAEVETDADVESQRAAALNELPLPSSLGRPHTGAKRGALSPEIRPDEVLLVSNRLGAGLELVAANYFFLDATTPVPVRAVTPEDLPLNMKVIGTVDLLRAGQDET